MDEERNTVGKVLGKMRASAPVDYPKAPSEMKKRNFTVLTTLTTSRWVLERTFRVTPGVARAASVVFTPFL
jgi:hypothetical protein